VTCHRAIPIERLEAVPEAVRCLNCQRLFEA
jgi:RNA polymerase-binding transcription factor DksA